MNDTRREEEAVPFDLPDIPSALTQIAHLSERTAIQRWGICRRTSSHRCFF
jgi:hypothetical protein